MVELEQACSGSLGLPNEEDQREERRRRTRRRTNSHQRHYEEILGGSVMCPQVTPKGTLIDICPSALISSILIEDSSFSLLLF